MLRITMISNNKDLGVANSLCFEISSVASERIVGTLVWWAGTPPPLQKNNNNNI